MNLNMNTALFALYPYIAVAVCVVGCWLRFDREHYTWRAGSSQLMRTKGMVLASNCFHIGILFILMGHFVGLFTPEAIYHHVITTEEKQMLAVVSGGFFVHIIYKLHVFSGISIVLVFPFTRLVHIISAPIWYFGRGYQIVRQKKAW